ncbi:uncharacterized protein LOC134705060 [Mytilus trossulus]|uniref:uncharacterized protein LOC134705060 n=1 Tax=Mytilus trossulus TaxID=6551 RepID=UPI003005B807
MASSSAVLAVVATVGVISAVLVLILCCLKTLCEHRLSRNDTILTEFSSLQNEDTAPENTAQNEGTLPPTYSNLSLLQLPPSYSDACIVADRQSLDSSIDIDRGSLGSISEEETVL